MGVRGGRVPAQPIGASRAKRRIQIPMRIGPDRKIGPAENLCSAKGPLSSPLQASPHVSLGVPPRSPGTRVESWSTAIGTHLAVHVLSGGGIAQFPGVVEACG